MSVKVMSLVWDNFPRGGSEKLVMLAMADWCNDQGGSLHPSVSTVAKKVCVTEKQARIILHRLIDDGYLSVIGNQFGGNPGQSRQYILNVEKLLTPPVEVTPPIEVTPPVEVRDPSRPREPDPSRPREPNHHISINNHHIEEKQLATRLPTDWIPSDSDIEFIRKERPDLNVKDTVDGFRDHWISEPGVKGRKLDWSATWRNWVRRQYKQKAGTSRVQEARLDVVNQIFGRVNHGIDNTVIDITPTVEVQGIGTGIPKNVLGSW